MNVAQHQSACWHVQGPEFNPHYQKTNKKIYLFWFVAPSLRFQATVHVLAPPGRPGQQESRGLSRWKQVTAAARAESGSPGTFLQAEFLPLPTCRHPP